MKVPGNLGPHGQRFWLKLDALENMKLMSVTELTFHLEISELKLDAQRNMPYMCKTELTSHLEMSELKLDA
jgi:hypothetical protein